MPSIVLIERREWKTAPGSAVLAGDLGGPVPAGDLVVLDPVRPAPDLGTGQTEVRPGHGLGGIGGRLDGDGTAVPLVGPLGEAAGHLQPFGADVVEHQRRAAGAPGVDGVEHHHRPEGHASGPDQTDLRTPHWRHDLPPLSGRDRWYRQIGPAADCSAGSGPPGGWTPRSAGPASPVGAADAGGGGSAAGDAVVLDVLGPLGAGPVAVLVPEEGVAEPARRGARPVVAAAPGRQVGRFAAVRGADGRRPGSVNELRDRTRSGTVGRPDAAGEVK